MSSWISNDSRWFFSTGDYEVTIQSLSYTKDSLHEKQVYTYQ